MNTLFAIGLALLMMGGQTTKTTTGNGNVYCSEHGAKYHTHKECQYIKGRDNVKAMSIKEAESKGKTICSRCENKDKKAKEGKK